jgi:hypothetical protein
MIRIQASYFADNSFVLHKIKVGKSYYSAWFEANGTLKDAEKSYITRRGYHSTRRIPTSHTKVRAELTKIGKRYIKKV